MSIRRVVSISLLLAACDKSPARAPSPSSSAPAPAASTSAPVAPVASAPATPALPDLAAKSFPLPAGSGPASFDYIDCDRKNGKVWIPSARDTGTVEVFDVAKGTFSRITGLKVEQREVEGRKRVLGPSAVSVGDGVAYVGNRATREVCAFDAVTLKAGPCAKVATSTDGVVYVASAKEVWVTAPHEKTITVLDAGKPDALRPKATIKLDGEPEGYAIDNARGLFYTNLEDKNRTLVIDVKTHAVTATWTPGCSDDGPRGLAFDGANRLLAVACTDHVQILDAGHDGALLGKLDTGAGVDNLDFLEAQRWLFVGAGKAGRLTVARLDPKGQLAAIAGGASAPRARNAVADANGNAYVIDPAGPALLAFPAPPRLREDGFNHGITEGAGGGVEPRSHGSRRRWG